MSLKLRLKPRERVVINGCVVQNENRRYTLTISNFAQIIRGNDIMQEDEADTPVRRAYFLIQSMLLEPRLAGEYAGVIADMMAKLYGVFARPDIQDQIMQAMQNVSERNYYKALTCLRPVMAYEASVLAATRPAAEGVAVAVTVETRIGG